MNIQHHDNAAFDDNATVAQHPDIEDKGRRRLIFGGIAAALVAVTAACSDDPDGSIPPSSALPPDGEGSSVPTADTDESSDTTTEDDGEVSSVPSTVTDESSDTTTEDVGAVETPTSEPGGGEDAATSDGKNQEADVPVRPGDVDGGRDPNNPTAKELSPQLSEDLATVEFAAGLEVLAINAYQRASLAAAGGALGSVPPAIGEFIHTVMGHHQAALDELNRTLLLSGLSEVTLPDAQLQPVVDSAFEDITDAPGAARLALMLEEIAAATYLVAIPVLKSPEAIALAAAIYPIDMQHASVLHFVLGDYPVPDVFGTVDKAASPA